MANAKFDSKSFNPEAFKYLVDRTPNLKLNELRKSKALVGNPDIRGVFSSQDGTAYARLAMRGLLDGEAVNYDGSTNITASSTKTLERGVVVVGRAKGWVEKDFSYDITGGIDFMGNIAAQVGEYWQGIDQSLLISVLKGVFAMGGNAKDEEFVVKHTYDITSDTTKTVGATTLNNAINKACGANKKKFTMVFLNSDVATNLENLQLMEYLKYTDKDGVQRELGLGSWNGKLVIIDDDLPAQGVVDTAGVHTIKVNTAATAGDKIEICGVTYKWVTNGSSPSATEIELPSTNNVNNEASAIQAKLAAVTSGEAVNFTWTVSSATVTATQKNTKPEAYFSAAVDTGAATFVCTITKDATAPVISTNYTTYILGDGAFDFEDIGAKVPYEMDRNPALNGGEDTLYTRQRKVYAPKGISYEKVSQASLSPTNAELENGANWCLAHSGEPNAADRTYIDHRAIPIARIISKG